MNLRWRAQPPRVGGPLPRLEAAAAQSGEGLPGSAKTCSSSFGFLRRCWRGARERLVLPRSVGGQTASLPSSRRPRVGEALISCLSLPVVRSHADTTPSTTAPDRDRRPRYADLGAVVIVARTACSGHSLRRCAAGGQLPRAGIPDDSHPGSDGGPGDLFLPLGLGDLMCRGWRGTLSPPRTLPGPASASN